MDQTLPLIVICTETEFEWKSRLLVRSLRTFGGRLAAATIVSYSPRSERQPSEACRADFRQGDVVVICDPLNCEFPDYGLANKAIAMADAERRFPGRFLVFLDSDKVVMREPSDLLSLNGRAFAARPVDVSGCGAAGFDGRNGEYWLELYRVCGVSQFRFVNTSIHGERIFEYYNSGMISAPSSLGLFGAWLQNLRAVWTEGIRPQEGDFFVEQSVLAATVSALEPAVTILPPTYNIPLHFFRDFPNWHWEVTLPQCVSLHYHWVFNAPQWRDLVAGIAPMLGRERSEWLIANLDELSPPTLLSSLDGCGASPSSATGRFPSSSAGVGLEGPREPAGEIRTGR